MYPPSFRFFRCNAFSISQSYTAIFRMQTCAVSFYAYGWRPKYQLWGEFIALYRTQIVVNHESLLTTIYQLFYIFYSGIFLSFIIITVVILWSCRVIGFMRFDLYEISLCIFRLAVIKLHLLWYDRSNELEFLFNTSSCPRFHSRFLYQGITFLDPF